MIISNGNIFTAEGEFQTGQVYIKEHKIERIVHSEKLSGNMDVVLDASGMYVLPGLVDIHSHGAAGYDFCDATNDAFCTIEEYQLKNGVTTMFPATMTLEKTELEKIFKAAGEYKTHSKGVICGITMEGPFLSKEKKGAQNEVYLRKPDIGFFEKMQGISGGLIRQVAVAPEEDENFEFISGASAQTIVSLAHTVADYETAKRAFASGATHVTHLLNGMNPFSHREPGVVGAAYDKKDVYVELICDGVHIHPSMVRAMFELFSSKRICMISDSMRATGMPDGEYTLGGQKVWLRDGKATLKDGTIAGSVCNLYDCLKKAVLKMNIPLEDAILACTKTPAKSLGVDDKCGILDEGRTADIVILNENLEIQYVIKSGQVVV